MKYRLIEVEEYTATRDVYLKNEVTNKIEKCFDDSDWVCKKSFYYMEIGKVYECKLMLFGSLRYEEGKDVLKCIVSNDSVFIGEKEFIQVNCDENIYYIRKSNVGEQKIGDILYYYTTRIDLIQVDNLIHEDMFKDYM